MELLKTILGLIAFSCVVAEVKIHNNEVCKTYKSNILSRSAYYRWSGANVGDCVIGFTRQYDNTMICIKTLSYSITSCSQEIGYYKLITSGTAPERSIGCKAPPSGNWCCNTGTVNVKISGSADGTFFFEAHIKPINDDEDDCLPKPPVSIVTPKPPVKGVLNTEVLTQEICNANQVVVVNQYPAMYQWSPSLVESCTVGFHNLASVDATSCLCVDVVDFVFKDCQYEVEYYGITTSGKPKKVIDCNLNSNRWCTQESTVKVKFRSWLDANDLFVFKVYTRSNVNQTCSDTTSAANIISLNALLLILLNVYQVLGGKIM